MEVFNISSPASPRTTPLQKKQSLLLKASSSPVPLETTPLNHHCLGNSNVTPLPHLLTHFYLLCLSIFSTPFQAMSKFAIQLNIDISCKFSARSVLLQEGCSSLVSF